MTVKRQFLSMLLPLLFASAASAQTTAGIVVTKTCPNSFITPGATFQCSGTVQNLDPANTVVGLVVVNTPQESSSAAIPCLIGGNAVTTLQPKGTPGDTCSYIALETAPACNATTRFFTDIVDASGTDSGTNLPVTGFASGFVQIPPCTPTPNGTPTNTPVGGTTATATSTATPTNTRTTTPTATTTNALTSTNTPTVTPTATGTNTPATTPTGAPTGVATATPTSTPVLTGTPANLRRQPRPIPFRPTISTASGAAIRSFPPLVVLAALLSGAFALARR